MELLPWAWSVRFPFPVSCRVVLNRGSQVLLFLGPTVLRFPSGWISLDSLLVVLTWFY